MKLETTAGSLHSALVAAMPFVERRSTIPILSAVLIDNGKVIATNLDMIATIPVASTRATGSAAVVHSVLMKLLSFIPRDEAITLAGGGEGVTLSFSGGRYELPKFATDDFPKDTCNGPLGAPSPAGDLVKAIKFVAPFICTEETRYYLDGVCFDGDIVVATDGHSLGRMKTGLSVTGRPIVPRGAVAQIIRRQIDRVAFGERHAEFVGPGIKIVSKLIDATYPDFNRVIPGDEVSAKASEIEVKTASLSAAYKRLGSLRRSAYTSMAISPFGDVAVFSKRHDFDIAGHEFLSAERVARIDAPVIISVNSRKIITILANYRDCETVTIKFSERGAPIEIVSRDDRYSLLMPLRGAFEKEVVSDLANHPAAEARRMAA